MSLLLSRPGKKKRGQLRLITLILGKLKKAQLGGLIFSVLVRGKNVIKTSCV